MAFSTSRPGSSPPPPSISSSGSPPPEHRRPNQRRSPYLYDDKNLYVGFVCFDSMPERIRVNDLREDFTFNGTDSVGLVFDSPSDNRSGFQFGTNPAGAKRDSQISNDGSFNNARPCELAAGSTSPTTCDSRSYRGCSSDLARTPRSIQNRLQPLPDSL
jgi:hypothetical protein